MPCNEEMRKIMTFEKSKEAKDIDFKIHEIFAEGAQLMPRRRKPTFTVDWPGFRTVPSYHFQTLQRSNHECNEEAGCRNELFLPGFGHSLGERNDGRVRDVPDY